MYLTSNNQSNNNYNNTNNYIYIQNNQSQNENSNNLYNNQQFNPNSYNENYNQNSNFYNQNINPSLINNFQYQNINYNNTTNSNFTSSNKINNEQIYEYDKTQYTMNKNPYLKIQPREQKPELINLENIDWRNHSMKISSPHSKHIMRENNIEEEDLYLYDFFEYRELHPEIIPLSLDIQKSHFYNDLNKREERLSKLIQLRRQLLFTEETKTSLEEHFNNKETEEEKQKRI